MDFGTLVGVAAVGAGVIGSITIHLLDQAKAEDAVKAIALAALGEAQSLTVPELVVVFALKDGVQSRGKVIQCMAFLVQQGLVVELPDEPGVTSMDRVARKRFSVKR